MKPQRNILALALSFALAFPIVGRAAQGHSEFQINSTVIGSQVDPQVAFDAAGNFVVVWLDRGTDSFSSAVLAQRYDRASRPLGDELRVNSTHPGELFSPLVAGADDGSFVVVWSGRESSIDETATIFAQRFGRGGAPQGDEQQIHSMQYRSGFTVALADDSEGNFVVVWQSWNGEGTGVSARRFDPMGVPRGEDFVVSAAISGVHSRPAVAPDADGGFVVVWIHGEDSTLRARRYDNAGVPSGEELQTSDVVQLPAVTSDAVGGFVVVWRSESEGISGRHYDGSAEPLGESFLVTDFRANGGPAIAADGDGGFLVVWTDDEADEYAGRHFSASDEPQGGRFRINVAGYNLPDQPPAVTGVGDGNYVVVYQSPPWEYDIFGRYLADDERAGVLQFFPDSASVREGAGDFMGVEGSTAMVTVIRSGGGHGDVTVEGVLDGGTATSGEDYDVASSVRLTFPQGGEDVRSFPVELSDDEKLEGDETILWRLASSDASVLLAEPSTATLTVLENDFSASGSRPAPQGPEFQVNTSQELSHITPAAAVTHGDSVVVWESRDATNNSQSILARRYDSTGEALGSEFTVSDSETRGYLPSVAFDPAGNFVVVWNRSGSNRGRSFSSTGEALGGDFVVMPASSYYVHVVSGPAGRFVLSWEEKEPGRSLACIRQIELDGDVFGDAYCDPFGHGIRPVAATAPSGDFLLSWQWLSSFGGVMAQRFDSTGQPQGDRFRMGDGSAPAIAADGSGAFVVASEGYSNEASDVFAWRLPQDSEAPAGIVRANSFTIGNQQRPQVAADAAGNFVVIWESYGFGGPSTAQDGSGKGIFGQRFNSSGAPTGGEFPIPTRTHLHQGNPAIAAHANGDLLVVWDSERAGGGYDVMARRFFSDACVEDAFTLCLGEGRFQVRATWRDFVGNTGVGRVQTLTADTGAFWFFNPDNREILLKVLDGRLINGHFWVFFGSLSNVEFSLTVTDTLSGAMREYFNPLHQFASVGDTMAFPSD
jgi:hypothetical protein